MITFKRGEVVKLPLKRKKARVYIEPELASTIVPTEIRPGVSLASVIGELEVKDNVYTIKVSSTCVRRKDELYKYYEKNVIFHVIFPRYP